jgi:hypothetical protein
MTEPDNKFPLISLKYRRGTLFIYSEDIYMSITKDMIHFFEGEKVVLSIYWSSLTAINLTYTPLKEVLLVLEPSHRNPTLPEIPYITLQYHFQYAKYMEREIADRKIEWLLKEKIPEWMLFPVIEIVYKRQYRQFFAWAMKAIQVLALLFFIFEGIAQIPKYLPKTPGAPSTGEKVKNAIKPITDTFLAIIKYNPVVFYLVSAAFFIATLPFLWVFYIFGGVLVALSRWSVLILLLTQCLMMAQHFKPFTAVVSSVFRIIRWAFGIFRARKKEKEAYTNAKQLKGKKSN